MRIGRQATTHTLASSLACDFVWVSRVTVTLKCRNVALRPSAAFFGAGDAAGLGDVLILVGECDGKLVSSNEIPQPAITKIRPSAAQFLRRI